MNSPALRPDADDIEWEIAELIADHGSERAALRAVLMDLDALLLDAYRGVPPGEMRSRFLNGVAAAVDDE